MSDFLPLFQPECSFSYSTIDLAAEGISISPHFPAIANNEQNTDVKKAAIWLP